MRRFKKFLFDLILENSTVTMRLYTFERKTWRCFYKLKVNSWLTLYWRFDENIYKTKPTDLKDVKFISKSYHEHICNIS